MTICFPTFDGFFRVAAAAYLYIHTYSNNVHLMCVHKDTPTHMKCTHLQITILAMTCVCMLVPAPSVYVAYVYVCVCVCVRLKCKVRVYMSGSVL